MQAPPPPPGRGCLRAAALRPGRGWWRRWAWHGSRGPPPAGMRQPQTGSNRQASTRRPTWRFLMGVGLPTLPSSSARLTPSPRGPMFTLMIRRLGPRFTTCTPPTAAPSTDTTSGMAWSAARCLAHMCPDGGRYLPTYLYGGHGCGRLGEAVPLVQQDGSLLHQLRHRERAVRSASPGSRGSRQGSWWCG